MFDRVTIIGLGLIGGSIGLALRQARAARQIVGYDPGRGVSDLAYRIGAIDQSTRTPDEAVHEAELVILATPVGAMGTLLQHLAPYVASGTVITDVASTKAQVISWAEQFLPASVPFVGGHPMAGKEVSGVEAADATLFLNCVYCLTPTPRTCPAAIHKVSTLVEILGAQVHFLDPDEHDWQVAAISHLPFIASTALVNTVAESAEWQDVSLLAASGFRDVSRLAAGSPNMYRDICLTNGDAIRQWLDRYISLLSTMRDRIAARDRNLDETFTKAQQARLQWQLRRKSTSVQPYPGFLENGNPQEEKFHG